MPELPEVESIKRSLSSNIVGQKLENYKIYDHRTNRYNTKKPTIKEVGKFGEKGWSISIGNVEDGNTKD